MDNQEAIETIKSAQSQIELAIDQDPPERKIGKWIFPYETTRLVSICSECGAHGRGDFCSNCYADMRSEQDER